MKPANTGTVTLTLAVVTVGRPNYSKMTLTLNSQTFALPFAVPATVEKVRAANDLMRTIRESLSIIIYHNNFLDE